MKLKYLLLAFFSLMIISCGEESYDPEESFELWAQRDDVPKEIEVINGQFWKSTHWTYEYITFLHFKAPKKWIEEFIRINELKIAVGNHTLPDDAPKWFIPEVGQKVYIPKEFSQGSMYFVNEETGEVLFYEIQL